MPPKQHVALRVGHEMGEDHGAVVTADEVTLAAARRDVRELLLEAPGFVDAEAGKEKTEELFLLEARGEVLDLRVIKEELKKMSHAITLCLFCFIDFKRCDKDHSGRYNDRRSL